MEIRTKSEEMFSQGYNCAESIIASACAGCSPDAVKAAGAFGGGMGCQKTCGALAGAVCAIGIMTVETRHKESKIARSLIKKFTLQFEEKFGSCNCCDLRPKYSQPNINCKKFVGDVAEFLEEFVSQNIV